VEHAQRDEVARSGARGEEVERQRQRQRAGEQHAVRQISCLLEEACGDALKPLRVS
jgi:hypothetical protein